MDTDKHGFKHFGLKPEFKRLIFDNPRKATRGNPHISIADLLVASDKDAPAS